MKKLKVEAIRVQLGLEQQDFINKINKRLDNKLSIRTYNNRIKRKVKWRIDEALAISKLSGIPIEDIEF